MVSDDENDENMNNEYETDDKSVSSSTNVRCTNTKLFPAMRHLKTLHNYKAKKLIEEAIEKANHSKAVRDIICLALQSISTLNDVYEPQIFKDS